jgi:hypothetical protein
MKKMLAKQTIGERIDSRLGRCGLMSAHRIRVRSDARNQRVTADAVARLLWDAKGNLKVRRMNTDNFAEESPDPEWGIEADVRLPEIDLPGGTILKIRKALSEEDQNLFGFGRACKVQYSITTPTGIDCELRRTAAAGLDAAWYTIVADAIVEALAPGAYEPHAKPDARSSQTRLTELVCSIVRNRGRDAGKKRDEIYRRCHSSYSGKYRDQSLWRGIGEGIETHLDPRSEGQMEQALVSHPLFGSIEIPYSPIAMAIEQKSYETVARGLGIATIPAHPVPTPTGNARAARVMRIARDAVTSFPDLKDASGTEIAPLVHKHLPSLLRRHADASATAPANEMAAIDAELDEGLETIRAAVEEALAVESGQRRDALRTEIAFLKARHPVEDEALRTVAPNRVAA